MARGGEEEVRPPAIVSAEWLAAHREDPPVRLIDARSDLKAYLAGHLPGAVFVHVENLRAARGGVPAMLLPPDVLAKVFGGLGVSRDHYIVIYSDSQGNNHNATFVAWALQMIGAPRISVLNGGIEAWIAQGGPLSQEYPPVTEVDFRPRPDPALVADLPHVRESLEKPGEVLVDARPVEHYTGQSGITARKGHIPGAVDHFWMDDLVGQGTKVWKSAGELQGAYAAQGITPDKEVIVYCNSGVQASHVYFTLRNLLGYPTVRVYDGSWVEWSAGEDLPVEVGEGHGE